MATPPPYDDDGSSTETEVYFDPQELAAYQRASTSDVHVKQEVVDLTGEDEDEDVSNALELPQGSEWSHGAVSHESDVLAVEKALEMAGSLDREKQREESLTADTMKEVREGEVKRKEKEKQVRSLKKREETSAKPRIVSLKGSTPPPSVTKPVAVGLMRPLSSVVGAPTELEMGLSVPRSGQRKTGSPSSISNGAGDEVKRPVEHQEVQSRGRRERSKSRPRPRTELSRSPSRYRAEHSKSTPRHRAASPPRRSIERSKSRPRLQAKQKRGTSRHREPCRQEERGTSPSRRRMEHSKSTPRPRAESSPRQPVERSKSHVRHEPQYSRESSRNYVTRSKSPPRRQPASSKVPSRHQTEYTRSPSRYRDDRGESPASHYSRRSRSRSPPRARRVVETRRDRSRSAHRAPKPVNSRQRDLSDRSYRTVETTSSPRQNRYDTEKLPSRAVKRSRSPSRSGRSHQACYDTHRSRSGSRDRLKRHDETKYDRYSRERSSAVREADNLAPYHPNHVRTSHEARHVDQGVMMSSLSHQGKHKVDSSKFPNSSSTVQVNHNSGRSRQKHDVRTSQPNQPSAQSTKKKLSPVVKSQTSQKKKRKVSATPWAIPKLPRGGNHANPVSNDKGIVTTHNPHDKFASKVFKLKLQEEDVKDKAAAGSLDPNTASFLEHRRKKIAEDKERLEGEDYERFWELYESTSVPTFELKNYQKNRDFAWRVVQYKRKQTSLQEQEHLSLSPETAQVVRQRLGQERQALLTENAFMFHKIMMDPKEGGVTHASRNFVANAFTPMHVSAARQPMNRAHHEYFDEVDAEQPPLKRRASGGATYPQHIRSFSSRVIVGDALRRQGSNISLPIRSRSNNTAWFLKG